MFLGGQGADVPVCNVDVQVLGVKNSVQVACWSNQTSLWLFNSLTAFSEAMDGAAAPVTPHAGLHFATLVQL